MLENSTLWVYLQLWSLWICVLPELAGCVAQAERSRPQRTNKNRERAPSRGTRPETPGLLGLAAFGALGLARCLGLPPSHPRAVCVVLASEQSPAAVYCG